jgi:hypothetical protein
VAVYPFEKSATFQGIWQNEFFSCKSPRGNLHFPFFNMQFFPLSLAPFALSRFP